MYQLYFAISGMSLLVMTYYIFRKKGKSKVKRDMGLFNRLKNKRSKRGSFKRRVVLANMKNGFVRLFSIFKKKENYLEIGGKESRNERKYNYQNKFSGRKTKFDHLFEHKVVVDEEKKKEFLKKIEEYKKQEQEEKKKNKIIKPWGFGSVLPDRNSPVESNNYNAYNNQISNSVWNNSSEKKENNVGFFGRFGKNESNSNAGYTDSANKVNNYNSIFGNNQTNRVNENNVGTDINDTGKENINIFGNNSMNVNSMQNNNVDVNNIEKKEIKKEDSDEDKDNKIDFFRMFSN